MIEQSPEVFRRYRQAILVWVRQTVEPPMTAWILENQSIMRRHGLDLAGPHTGIASQFIGEDDRNADSHGSRHGDSRLDADLRLMVRCHCSEHRQIALQIGLSVGRHDTAHRRL
jgi:hypothetical protein